MIRIGEKMESFSTNPLGLLSDCHRRIEDFLNRLISVTRQGGGGALSAEQRTVLEGALRYFREAAPKHRMDEEESLFPRISALQRPEAKPALARLAALEQDHAAAEAAHEEVERLGGLWLAKGGLTPDEAGRLGELLGRLSALYQKHIQIEEADIFPLAGKILDPAAIKAIGEEMAARRGLRAEDSGRPHR